MAEFDTGVYVIRCRVDGKVYIGGAYVSFEQRKVQHFTALAKGKHHSRHLQHAWNKYGQEAFVFMVMETCAPEDVKAAEQRWLDQVRPYELAIGYNICQIVDQPPIGLISEERRQKRCGSGNSMYGKKLTEEHKRALDVAKRGKKRSAETRYKIREALTGVPLTEERRQKIADAHRGKPLSEEHRQTLSEAMGDRHSGSNNPMSRKSKLLRGIPQLSEADLLELARRLS